MEKRVLITGITGFVGSHLAEYCLSKEGVKVYGTMISNHLGEETERIKEIKDKIFLIECDLTNRVSVSRAIEESKPDIIFHLAAQSFVPVSWQSPEGTLTNNIISELNIFEVLRETKINAKVVIACSSEEYGLVLENELPIKETNQLRPLSPYGVSKVCQDMLAFQYHKSYGTKAIITRFFNTEGPRRGQDFVISNFAKQIAKIEKGKQDPIIFVGNLDAKRDFSDVRDMVRAYWLAAEKCNPGEPYNISSGKSVSIKSVLDTLLNMSSVKDIKVVQDEKKMRPSDVLVLQGDSSKFRQATGWQPEISLEKTLQDTLDYWREKV
jgi:GDP-4-dehydro-6-deoxy-D-mannose reductase